MDMDMDVAWCLTCSKQTRDARSPYCSEECRLQDTHPTAGPSNPVSLTSAVPYGLIPSPSKATHSGNPTPRADNSPIRRPSIGPLAPLPSSGRSKPLPRDRRAFSFPATQSIPPVFPSKTINSRRPTQTGETLQFFRRTNPVSANMTASPSANGLSAPKVKGFDRLSKTTGANTPVIQDSVFCSTSESSDNEALDLSPLKMPNALPSLETTVRPSNVKRASMSHAFMSASPRGTSFTPLSQPVAGPSVVSRKSPSPVATMVATSASSKSREDIVSWLNEVKRLPSQHEDDHRERLEDTYQPRGRSRTRKDVITNMPTAAKETLEEHEGENGMLGTTPKGRIGSALAGFSSFGGFGVGPIVKALTGVTSTNTTRLSSLAPPAGSATAGLGLQSVPAPAEISRIAVTVAAPSDVESTNYLQMGGTTPTLSTISVSEVIDPLTDSGDHVEFMTTTDDQSATGSNFYMRRRMSTVNQSKAPSSLLSIGGKQAPAKPVTSTASAIWNLSSYLRSFAPFSISSVIPPYAPIAAQAQPKQPSPVLATNALLPEETVPAPLPAQRSVSPKEAESPAQQMVRSLPMDIVIPIGGENTLVDRARQREEVKEWLGTPLSSRSASRSMIRDDSRSKGRLPSRSGCHSRSASHSRHHAHARHGRKISYDADASAEEEESETFGMSDIGRRGRSRREKGLRRESFRGSDVRAEAVVEEEGRGRGRGRDRDTTVRV
ncbi:uncharacterized protein L201_000634 [Kwoniella dendrophila CBS 6074]|uniref:Uncharacterized protein n=1 Tax=Kwoniella dendrophila CBS 6074 TaxID=1295534 RepID=A0AAX4JMY6_9TREE